MVQVSDEPLILGAGPAGCAAAIELARAGASPLLIDRHETPRDPLCGGFLSWRTFEQLRALGIDCAALGAHRVDTLALFTPGQTASVPLPRPAFGLSRHALDSAMRKVAIAQGAQFACDLVRSLAPGEAIGRERTWRADSIFLATGKEDVRGHSRPRKAADPALGLRIRLAASPERRRLMQGQIELHLFKGGYAGIVLQEDGSANVCLALRKSALSACDNDPRLLLAHIAQDNCALAARFGEDWHSSRIETIGAVPYGFIARETERGLFRLGDQAAVIPSLAGEGIGLALASGVMAAQTWSKGGAGAAIAYQQQFARAAQRPVRTAAIIRRLAESPVNSRLAILAARHMPALFKALARATRIEAPPSLARETSPA